MRYNCVPFSSRLIVNRTERGIGIKCFEWADEVGMAWVRRNEITPSYERDTVCFEFVGEVGMGRVELNEAWKA